MLKRALFFTAVALTAGFIGLRPALAAQAPVINYPASNDNYTAASLVIQATSVTGAYRSIGLSYADGKVPDKTAQTISMGCKTDPSNKLQQLCAATVDMTRLIDGHVYYYQVFGNINNERTVGNYISIRRVQLKPQPVIVSPTDGKSYTPTQPQIYREIVVEDKSGQPYYGIMQLTDEQGKVYRKDNFNFSKNKEGKYLGTLDLNMRQQTGNAMLPAGTYYLQAFGYVSGSDRSKNTNGAASAKVRVSYSLQVAKLKFTMPVNNATLPACRIRVQVAKDETYGTMPAVKYTRFDLTPSVGAGDIKANKPNAMIVQDGANAYLDWDLSLLPAKSRVQLGASGYYQPEGAKNPIRIDAPRVSFSLAAKDAATTNGCNQDFNNQILYFLPTMDKLCLGGSGKLVSGPEPEKNVWQPNDNSWGWTCFNPCSGGAVTTDNCSSVAPQAQLTTVDNNNGLLDFSLKANVPAARISRVELWAVPVGRGIKDSGARKLTAFKSAGNGYYTVTGYAKSSLKDGENNFLGVIFTNVLQLINGLYVQVWSNASATQQLPASDGICGASHGKSMNLKPTSGLCADESMPMVYGSGPWTWTCAGKNGGHSIDCRAEYAVKADAQCGPAVKQNYKAGEAPLSGFCLPDSLAHSALSLNNDGLWTWTCYGLGDGLNAVCTTSGITPQDGVCGAAHGQSFSTQPVKDLCGDGSLPAVSGSGPWNWLCAGRNGGQTVSCMALKWQSDGTNKKDPSKYFTKQAFVLNDSSWQTALSYLPVAVWTTSAGETIKYPLLVYKNESNRMDLDAPIHFLQQYQAGHVSLIDHSTNDAQRVGSFLAAPTPIGAGVLSTAIDSQKSTDLLSYWISFNDVVYVENDYEKALVASTYASLINAPLIIKSTALDNDANFTGRNIICVGTVSRACSVKYATLDSLRDQYLLKAKELTGRSVNKLILTNPRDWDYSIRSTRPENPVYGFKTSRTGDYLNSYFGKQSLASAYLAAAKQELIITAASDIGSTGNDSSDPNYYTSGAKRSNAGSNCADSGNRFKCSVWSGVVTSWAKKLNLASSSHPSIAGQRLLDGYLTIVADPQAIPMRTRDQSSSLFFYPADKYIFANTEGNYQPELAYGRIAGFTISDASAYVNLAVFYNKIAARNTFALFSSRANGDSVGNNFVNKACTALKSSGYSAKACFALSLDQYGDKYNGGNFDQKMIAEANLWQNNDLNYFHDHGNENFAGIMSEYLPPLANSFVGTMACSTAEASINVNQASNFALMALRQGAIGYIGSVDETYEHDTDKQFISTAYYSNKTLQAGKIFVNYTRWLPDTYLGDPTIAIVGDQPGARGANQSLYK
ncbi:MAG: hypothetical protein WCO55_00535 [Candidatus Falkowbacteria bacterium]